MTMMMMMMMNCFCAMVDQSKAFTLISSWDHCQKSSLLRISKTPQAKFKPVQNLSLSWMKLYSSDSGCLDMKIFSHLGTRSKKNFWDWHSTNKFSFVGPLIRFEKLKLSKVVIYSIRHSASFFLNNVNWVIHVIVSLTTVFLIILS